MKFKKITICLDWAGAPRIEGCGNQLTMRIEGHRTNKAGNIEEYKIEAKLSRHHIQRLAREIATMHQRDRQRLQRELNRIELEQQAITQPESEQ